MPSLLLLAATAALALASPYSYSHIRRGGSGHHFSSPWVSYLGSAALRSSASLPAVPSSVSGSQTLLNSADGSEPTAAAALNFISAVSSSELCGAASRAYLESVLAGGSGVVATKAAEAAYKAAWSAGNRVVPNSPCAAAEISFKTNYGGNAVLPAALEYLNAAAPTACGQAGKAYVAAITDGQSTERAALFAARAFIDASAGGAVEDAACAAAMQGYKESVSRNDGLNSAFDSFVTAGASGFDPVCAAAASSYLDAKIARLSDEAAFSAAAKAYVGALQAHPGAGSSCLAGANGFLAN